MTHDLGDLYPNERVLWTGSPTRFPIFNRADLLLVPFSILWFGLLTFMMANAAGSDVPGPIQPFLIFGGLFVVIGLYLVFGRFILRRLSLRNTHYVVTDRRVIANWTVLGRRRQQTAYLKDLPPPIITGRDLSVGTIKFGDSSFMDELMAEAKFVPGSRPPAVRPVLVEVAGARQVRDLIATAQARSPAS